MYYCTQTTPFGTVTKSPKGDFGAVAVPENLATDRFRQAWKKWLAYRREIKHPLTATGAQTQLERMAQWGEARSVAAIEHTILRGWQGLREPDAPGIFVPSDDPRGNARAVQDYLAMEARHGP